MMLPTTHTALLAELLDTLPDGVVWYEAVRNESGAIVDFRVAYCNRNFDNYAGAPALGQGSLLMADHPGQAPQLQPLMDYYVQVVDTNEGMDYVSRDTAPVTLVKQKARKFGDGVLATIRDITVWGHLEDERNLLDGVLESLPDGVIVYRAVRDYRNQIVDFQTILFNEQALRLTGYTADQLRTTTLFERSAFAQGTGDQFIHLVETGESITMQRYSPERGWLEVRCVKLNDGFQVTLHNVTDQKQAELRIIHDNELLQAILNTSLIGTVVYEAIRDDSGKITDFRFRLFNQTAREEIMSQIGRDISQHTLLTIYPDSHETGLFDLYAQITETGVPIRREHYYPDIDTWYDVSLAKLNDGCVATFIDISQSKRTFEQAREQNALLNSVLDSAISGIISFKAIRQGGQIVDFSMYTVNKGALKLLNRSMDELLGNTLLTVFPGNVQAGLFDLYCHTTETGEPGLTQTYYNFDGLDFWLDISTQKLGDGFVVTFTDISEMKRAANQIEKQAQFVGTLLDASLNSVISLDPIYGTHGQLTDFRILSANRAAEVYMRRREAELVGKRLLDLFPQNHEMGIADLCKRVAGTRQAERQEAYLQTDDCEVWLDVSASPRDQDGLVVSFLDITERKKAQEQTDTLIQALQKSNANLEQFAYVASHDLQEPLRKVTSFGDILQTQYADKLGVEGRDFVARMQSASTRMQTLIKDLLTYSRVANTNDSFAPVDLNQVVADTLSDLELAILDRRAEVRVDPLPIVYGDAVQLRQMFQNLFSNGLKFIRPLVVPQLQVVADLVRGREAVRADGSPLLPESLANRGFHRIRISDNGIGFEPQYADRIFQVFQRLHTRSEYSGTGIGLSIVQKVVDNHRGIISAEGRPGEGATFIILLPIKML